MSRPNDVEMKGELLTYERFHWPYEYCFNSCKVKGALTDKIGFASIIVLDEATSVG